MVKMTLSNTLESTGSSCISLYEVNRFFPVRNEYYLGGFPDGSNVFQVDYSVEENGDVARVFRIQYLTLDKVPVRVLTECKMIESIRRIRRWLLRALQKSSRSVAGFRCRSRALMDSIFCNSMMNGI